jgi:hypothetical protein
MAVHQSRWIKTAKKLIFAVAIAFFLVLLGLFDGLGYHAQIKEISFTRYSDMNFAFATFNCNILYNPVLFPFYWLKGSGHLDGNFTHIFVAESYEPGEYGGPIFPMTPKARTDTYITKMVTWGTAENLVLLLALTLLIEALGKRSLYLVFFSTTICFAIASVIGAIVGVFLGAFAVGYILFRMSPESPLRRFWQSLWE